MFARLSLRKLVGVVIISLCFVFLVAQTNLYSPSFASFSSERATLSILAGAGIVLGSYLVLRPVGILASFAALNGRGCIGGGGKDLGELLNRPDKIYLDEEDNGSQIEISKGNILIISLEANPSTGYGWEIAKINEEILCQVGKTEFKPESDLLGAPGREILRFEAVGLGQTSLKLIHHRPWEKEVKPLKTFCIQVTVY